MKLACVVGYPIGHSMSPTLHNAGFQALGLDIEYEAWGVQMEELPATVERLRRDEMLGMQVTVPYKQAVMPLLDEIDATADAIGSVNTIVKQGRNLVGYNTDKDGFMRSLREAGCDPQGLRALVLGVGGAERAVACGLLEAGVSSIALAGRRPDRVQTAARQLAETATGRIPIAQIDWNDTALAEAAAAADLIVNCTSIGMRHTPQEQESPLAAELLRPGLWVADVVYNPLETKLLQLARQAGARTVDGLGMLVYQGVAAQVLWTGNEPPADIMRDAALKALEALD